MQLSSQNNNERSGTLEIRPSGASAVIVQNVPPDEADWFLDWQRGVTAAAESAPGYRATELYPPAEGQPDPWVILMHFDSARSLQEWIQSPVRAQWVDKLRDRAKDFELQTMPVGFASWFVEHAQRGLGPPSWKIVLSVVLALFPTVMLLAVFPGPYLAPLGFAASMLISNFLSVALLQWVVSPPLNRVLNPWLRANPKKDQAYSLAGLVVILLVLLLMVFVFRWLGIGGG